MATWPPTLPAPQKNIRIVPGDTRIDRKLQSGRTEFRRFGDGKPDHMKVLFRLTWVEWDIFKEFHAHELNLGINWFSASWLAGLGYNTHKARILGYPREVALQNHYVDVLCVLIVQSTYLIVTEDTAWPCEPTGAEPEPPPEDPLAYLYGGLSLQDCDEYDPNLDSWAAKTDIPLPARGHLSASTIGVSGYIYCGYSGGDLRDCDQYTPNSWTSKADIPLPARSKVSASTIGSYGYVFGSGYPNKDCEEYNPISNTWLSKTNLLSSRYDTAASTIGNRGYVYTGITWVIKQQDCDEYDPNLDSWAAKTDIPLPARSAPAATTIGLAGYVFGGITSEQDCDQYIAGSDVWAAMTDIPSPPRTKLVSVTVGSAAYIVGRGLVGNYCTRFLANAWAEQTAVGAPNRIAPAASTI